MILLPSPALSHAASRVSRPLVISGLAVRSWHASGRRRYGWVAAAFMTELTSIDGWMTISPEGGP